MADRLTPKKEKPEVKTFVAPRTSAEQTLAGIWTQILGTNHISIHDSFFELGGSSLLAIQMLFQIRQVFQVEIPLGSFLENPTVAELAVVIEEILAKEIENLSEEEVQLLLESDS